MLMGYNLYKDDVERIMMPALGLETYHNYTLLHDDLMDRADVRYLHIRYFFLFSSRSSGSTISSARSVKIMPFR